MTQAVLPDGTVLEFPDETSPEVIQGAVKRMLGVQAGETLAADEITADGGVLAAEDLAVAADVTPTEVPPIVGDEIVAEDQGYVSNVLEDIEGRKQDFRDIIGAAESGEQTGIETAVQLIGKVGFGTLMDLLGETVVSGAKTAGEGISAVTPDAIEAPVLEGVADAAAAFMATDTAQAGMAALGRGQQAYSEWASQHPREARNVEAIVDTALFLAPIKGKPNIKAKPTFARKLATKLDESGTSVSARNKADFSTSLVSPKKTKAVREDEILRSQETGVLKSRKVEPSTHEVAMADEVSKIAEIGPSKSLLGNLNVIKSEIKREAESLIAALKKNDVAIPRRETGAALDRATAAIKEKPLMVGKASETAERVAAEMRRLVDKHPGTASGLLKARKEFDRFVTNERPKLFDAKQENALTAAVKEVRDAVNTVIDERAANVAVKASLRKQSLLYGAKDNLRAKATDEATNSVLRLAQSVGNAIPIKPGLIGTIFSTGGLVGLGLATDTLPYMAAAIAGAGVVGVAGKKGLQLATGSGARKGLASLLRATDDAIRVTKDKQLISQLRADRAAVVEVIKQMGQE